MDRAQIEMKWLRTTLRDLHGISETTLRSGAGREQIRI
jgi:hypothetical protein